MIKAERNQSGAKNVRRFFCLRLVGWLVGEKRLSVRFTCKNWIGELYVSRVCVGVGFLFEQSFENVTVVARILVGNKPIP